jgi:hypothetical protein
MTTVLLLLLPAIVAFALLALRRYPGERLIEQARASRRPRRSRVAITLHALPALPRVLVPRGGALLAGRLAGRAPPRTGLVPRPV